MVKLHSKEKKVSEIILLVHPLFNIYNFPPPTKWQDPKKRKKRLLNSRLFLGAWGNQLKKAAANPKSLVVIVLYSYAEEQINYSLGSKLSRFIEFAKKQFGQRLFLVKDTIDPKLLEHEIERRGFVFEKELRGKSFGEYLDRCVFRETAYMEGIAGVGKDLIEIVSELSLKRKDHEKRIFKPQSVKIRRK